ncbi:MAG: 6-chlorohydroxyquinol-1,2-dioxygenase [Actinomycetota bacterium]|nr:6-chlorohydroxyquinol-1,2-dioxygenase [Actinomycetota bacterium]
MDSTKMTSERLQKVLPDAIAALHQVIEKHRVTEEEWSAVLAFLTEVGRQDEFVLLSDVTETSVLVDAISHEGDTDVTPSDVEGPLYREDPPWREKPVKIYEEYEGVENGDVLFVHGRVTSAEGIPISDAVLDIWQTGPDGGYDLWDERQPDYNFRGRFGVEEDGSYEFQTMVPKPYTVPTDGPVGRLLEATGQHPWRPAHIHFKVEAEGHEPLITQVFFPDDPYLDNDTIGAVKPALVRPLSKHENEEELTRRGLDAPFYTCEFDITLKPAMSAARA